MSRRARLVPVGSARPVALAMSLWCVISFAVADARDFVTPGSTAGARRGDRLAFEVVVQRTDASDRQTVVLEVIAADLPPGVAIPPEVRRAEAQGDVPTSAPKTMKGAWTEERPPKSWSLVRVEATGAAGSRDATSYSFVPADLMDVGFHEFASLFTGPEEARRESGDELRVQARLERSLAGLMAFVTILGENKVLRKILRAAKEASLLSPSARTRASLLIGRRVMVYYKIETTRIVPSAPAVPVAEGEGSHEIPVEVLVEDKKLGEFRLRVVRPRVPYSMTAGIIGISAAHPELPDRRVDVRLISASTSTP